MVPTQLPFALPHRESLSRADLIVSPSNRLAVAAIDTWPHWRHSVLTVVGPAGSGKTHLAHAFMEMSGARSVTAAEAERAVDTPGFAIVIDDLETCGLSQDRLFGLVNGARLGGGTLLITSSTAPEDLVSLPDLRSRLAAAARANLGPPDDGLLTSVLAKLFADRQLQIMPSHLRYLADRMERSLGKARLLVAAIDREALAAKEKIGPRLLKRVLDRDADTMCHRTVADDG